VADKYGFFKDEGLNVKLVSVTDGTAGIENLLAGNVDMTISGDDPVVRMIQTSPGARVVALIECSKAVGSMSFAVRTDKPFIVTGGTSIQMVQSLFDGDELKAKLAVASGSTAYITNLLKYFNGLVGKGANGITAAQFESLKDKMMIIDSASAHLLNGNVDIIFGSEDVALATANTSAPIVKVDVPLVFTPVFLSVNEYAYEHKKDAIEKAVRAYKKACDLMAGVYTDYASVLMAGGSAAEAAAKAMENDVLKFCVEYRGLAGWAASNQMTVCLAFEWKIGVLEDIDEYLNLHASFASGFFSGYDDFDAAGSTTDEFGVKIYGGEGKFVYSLDERKWVDYVA
jgi:ABC-type amino acid transport substrate-binding protein